MAEYDFRDIAAFEGVWVYCEQRQGTLMPTDFELISDHAMDLAKAAREIHEKNIQLTDAAKAEIAVLCTAVKDVWDLT